MRELFHFTQIYSLSYRKFPLDTVSFLTFFNSYSCHKPTFPKNIFPGRKFRNHLLVNFVEGGKKKMVTDKSLYT